MKVTARLGALLLYWFSPPSDIGCYGGEIETPHIDRLAAEVFVFGLFIAAPSVRPPESGFTRVLAKKWEVWEKLTGINIKKNDAPVIQKYEFETINPIAGSAIFSICIYVGFTGLNGPT